MKRNWTPIHLYDTPTGQPAPGHDTPRPDFEEILFEEYNGIAKITINRPRYRNAFTVWQQFK